MAIEWFKKSSPGRNYGKSTDSILVSYSTEKSGRISTVIRFRASFMEKMRWYVGDKLAVGYDNETCEVFVKRSQEGWSLSAQSVHGKSKTDVKGLSLGAIVTIAGDKFGKKRASIAENEITVEKDGTVIFAVA